MIVLPILLKHFNKKSWVFISDCEVPFASFLGKTLSPPYIRANELEGHAR
jgi:hypothetical protein